MKTMLRFCILLAILAGCANQPQHALTVHQRYELACTSTGAALGGLTQLRKAHKLSPATIAAIDAKKPLVDAKCNPASGDYPYTASEVELQALESATTFIKDRSKQP